MSKYRPRDIVADPELRENFETGIRLAKANARACGGKKEVIVGVGTLRVLCAAYERMIELEHAVRGGSVCPTNFATTLEPRRRETFEVTARDVATGKVICRGFFDDVEWSDVQLRARVRHSYEED